MAMPLSIAQPAVGQASAALNAANSVNNTIDVGGGVNFGEILKQYVQGSPENGGADIVIPSRLAMSSSSGSSLAAGAGFIDAVNSGYPIMSYLPWAALIATVSFVAYKMWRN